MGLNTGIEWATHTLNFWIGCTKVRAGCLHCYAEREMKRWAKDFNKVVRTSKQTWNQVKKYKPGDRIFICSWSDFFHKSADQWRNEAWQVIKSRSDVTWIILTKRIHRIHPQSVFPKNVQLGVSISTQEDADEMIPQLLQFDVTRILSIEPMLEPIDFVNGIKEPDGSDWWNGFLMDTNEGIASHLHGVIIGTESGPKKRLCPIKNIRDVVNQCKAANVPVFVKQIHLWNPMRKGESNYLVKDINQFPKDLRIRHYQNTV